MTTRKYLIMATVWGFVALAWLCPGVLAADVFNMPSGQTSLEFVTVGDPGNSGELSGGGSAGGYGPDRVCGAVAYVYSIGKYEVTAGQYTAFLNAVAKIDAYGLYHPRMDVSQDESNPLGCGIKRTGEPGNYTYRVASDRANRPVNAISWGRAARFCNWLANGQPSGEQGPATTEDGAYELNGLTSDAALASVKRVATAKYVIPSEDEWYKAAYYDPSKPGGARYWKYPTRSDTFPSNVLDPLGTNNASFCRLGTCTIEYPYYRTEVGAFAASPSPYGTFDQGGNVWEWTEEATSDGSRIQRGDGYMDAYTGCAMAAGYRLAGLFDDGLPAYWISNAGFRVAEVPLRDSDGDGVPDASDNCPNRPNPDQADADQNGVGDSCEPTIPGDGTGEPPVSGVDEPRDGEGTGGTHVDPGPDDTGDAGANDKAGMGFSPANSGPAGGADSSIMPAGCAAGAVQAIPLILPALCLMRYKCGPTARPQPHKK